MTTTQIVDAAGRPAGALSMVTDITMRKQADARHFELEAQPRESQKLEAIGTLAGGIAHDFNNILATILGNVALARQKAALDPAVDAGLEQIGKAATRARSLVQRILAFSRKHPHRGASLSLRPVVEDSVRLLGPLVPVLAQLELTLADTRMSVAGDATQLQQVVLNLCTNAWHALNGLAGRISIRLDAVALDSAAARRLGLPPSVCQPWVDDTGCGMDAATRARVFVPFFTTKPVGQGPGLGLSVVQGIVAAHGGAITVASKPRAGSRFDLVLPLLEHQEPAPPADPAGPRSSGSAGRHVVYIDDDPVMVAMVQALLRRRGYRVTCSEDPRDAVAALRVQPADFDMVVTDYNMPVLSGLGVAIELGQFRPERPVVITSGYVSDEMLAAARRAGVRSVMQKEYTLEQLPEMVQALLTGQDVVAG